MSASGRYIINSQTLTDIADAIRTKTGGSSPIAVEDMATEIGTISGGGVSSISISGDCTNFMVSEAAKNMYLALNSPEVVMTNVSNLVNAFAGNGGCPIDDYSKFKINSFINAGTVGLSGLFNSNTGLTKLPKLNASITSLGSAPSQNLFNGTKITSIPSDWETNLDVTKLKDGTSWNCSGWFQACYRLRSIPSSWLPNLYNSATGTNSGQKMWQYLFYGCYGLSEIDGFPCPDLSYTNNRFVYTFDQCCTLKTLKFVTNSGTAYTRSWKNQTIDLSGSVGHFTNGQDGTAAGLSSSKRITDAASYALLKNDPDAWTTDINYSRFDHDSAVALINSLPDTSAVSTPSSPLNKVMFKSGAGASTDAGAISTLTQAEIDVAVNKGWTVQLVS